MPFSKDPIQRSYQNQGVNDLIVTLNRVASKIEVHQAFQGEVSEYVYLSPRLREIASKLAIARDSGDLNQVNILISLGVQALDFDADHVIRVSQYRNDPALLHDAGYEFKPQGAGKPRVNLLDLVPELSLKHLEGVTGAYVVVAKRPKSTAIVELQSTETPEIEESWQGIGEGTFDKSRTEVRGVEPTKRIYARGRYHQNGRVGRWSPPVNIIIL